MIITDIDDLDPRDWTTLLNIDDTDRPAAVAPDTVPVGYIWYATNLVTRGDSRDWRVKLPHKHQRSRVGAAAAIDQWQDIGAPPVYVATIRWRAHTDNVCQYQRAFTRDLHEAVAYTAGCVYWTALCGAIDDTDRDTAMHDIVGWTLTASAWQR